MEVYSNIRKNKILEIIIFSTKDANILIIYEPFFIRYKSQ